MSTYACADLHGRLDLYKQIKAFLKPEDKVYYLGDAGDRGPEPWETIKVIYNDPQFIYLKGNHEDMLVKSFDDNTWGAMDAIALCCYNGGTKTRQQIMEEPDFENWVRRLKELPLREIYLNTLGQTVILTHAGYTPPIIPSDQELLWDRSHFTDPWPHDMDDFIIVHGHTPIPYVIKSLVELAEWAGRDINYPEWDGGACWYGDFHKICIDCASAYYDCCVLLNLDIWEEHIFRGEEFKPEYLEDKNW